MDNHEKKLIHRREFLKSSLLIASSVALTGATPVDSKIVVIENVKIPLPTLPEEFEGFRIGFVSDIHLSAYLGVDILEQTIQMLKGSDLDLLLLGGDYIWKPRDFTRSIFPIFRPEFADINHPDLAKKIFASFIEKMSDVPTREGIYAVLGNHDRWAAPLVCDQSFTNSPISLITNRSVLFNRNQKIIELIGTDDFLTGQPRFPAVEHSAAARILLTHNPDILPWYLGREKIRIDLALMGHTHGGQICMTPGSPIMYNITNTEFGSGMLRHPSGTYCYTTRGIGCVGLPLRINCPPEVTIVTLNKGSGE